MTRRNTWTNSDGLIVGYGPNLSDYDSVAAVQMPGYIKELAFELDGEKFSGGVYQFVHSPTIPVGALPVSCTVRTTEVFNLGGTTPTIQIGTSGSGAASVFGAVSETNAETLGTYVNSVTATPLTATTTGTLRVSLGGTSPTTTGVGKMKVVLQYRLNPNLD